MKKTLHVEQNGEAIAIYFSPEQCLHLAKACCFAGEHTLCKEKAIWQTLAQLFQACALAAYAQWHMDPTALELFEAQMKLDDLGELQAG